VSQSSVLTINLSKNHEERKSEIEIGNDVSTSHADMQM